MPHQPGRHAAVSPRELRRQAARRDAEFTEHAIAERAHHQAVSADRAPSKAVAPVAPVAPVARVVPSAGGRASGGGSAGAGTGIVGGSAAAGSTGGRTAGGWSAGAISSGRAVSPVVRPSARPARSKGSTRKLGRPLAILGVMAISTGLMVSVSLPAAAATVDPDAATGGAIPSAATMASVSYQVDPGTASPQIQRDAYTATSQSDVDAANAAAAASAAAAAASSASSSSGGSASSSATFAAPAVGRSGAAILAYASEFVGVVPYGNGNDPSDSFSCDGYVQYVFKAFGVNLPRGAGAQASTGVRISASEAVAGDLLYWPEGHIGIYDGNGGMYDSPDWGRLVQHRLSIWGDPEYIRIP